VCVGERALLNDARACAGRRVLAAHNPVAHARMVVAQIVCNFSFFFSFFIAVRVWLAPYDDTNPAPLLIKHKHEPKPFRASDGSEQRAAPPLPFFFLSALLCFAWCVVALR